MIETHGVNYLADELCQTMIKIINTLKNIMITKFSIDTRRQSL